MSREVPDEILIEAAKHGGMENERYGIDFPTAKAATAYLAGHAITVTLPDLLQERPATLRIHNDGRPILDVERRGESCPDGWRERSRPKVWSKILKGHLAPEVTTPDLDDTMRCLKSPDKGHVGWIVRCGDEWIKHPPSNVKMMLQNRGHSRSEAESLMGGAALNSWTIDNIPFAGFELPGRRINLDSPQLRFPPVKGEHPTWDKLFTHLGETLTPALRNVDLNPWAERLGILTGADYLLKWCASILQAPDQQLPYLFGERPSSAGRAGEDDGGGEPTGRRRGREIG